MVSTTLNQPKQLLQATLEGDSEAVASAMTGGRKPKNGR